MPDHTALLDELGAEALRAPAPIDQILDAARMRRRRLRAAVAGSCLVVALGAVGGAVAATQVGDRPNPGRATEPAASDDHNGSNLNPGAEGEVTLVPDVVGMAASHAAKVLTDVGLGYVFNPSSAKPDDVVRGTVPAAGSELPSDSGVVLKFDGYSGGLFVQNDTEVRVWLRWPDAPESRIGVEPHSSVRIPARFCDRPGMYAETEQGESLGGWDGACDEDAEWILR